MTTTGGSPAAGYNGVGLIFTQFGLEVEPDIRVQQNPETSINLSVEPSLSFLPPQPISLRVAPMIAMKAGTEETTAFNLGVTPSIGMSNFESPDTAFTLSAVTPSMSMTGGSRQPAALVLNPVASIGMSAVGHSVVSYDAASVGTNTGVVTSISWSHTATAGTLVLAAISESTAGDAPSNVKYGTTSMSLVGTAPMNNTGYGAVYVYKLASAPGGAQSISASFSSATYASGCSVSYRNVGSLGMAATVYGSSTSPSQSVSQSPGGIIFQAFGSYSANATASSGGTSRYLSGLGASGFAGLAAQDSAASNPTFNATLSTSTPWSGIAIPLIP